MENVNNRNMLNQTASLKYGEKIDNMNRKIDTIDANLILEQEST